ncbi:AAA family ATPase [Cylindrospermopsis raciborskii]|uniref:AAA family ATPase n=1 Tax=Cylindrospermopsis raciborskii TaxID=77022 RepID=UPI0022BD65E1|nr:AAA family ATPase [Cylindrospermopsis raciborskii]MCZ2205350.1 AAA family ATPase [Cylindrospermopsis raciborskii PAMP2011]
MKDLIIVGGLSCGIGIICGISIAGVGGITGRIGVGVLGSTTGAIMGASVVKSRQSREAQALKEASIALRKNLTLTRVDLERINEEKIRQEQQIENIRGEYGRKQVELEQWQDKLKYIETEYGEKQDELKELNQDINALTQQEQELQNRLVVINRQNPNLHELEELGRRIEASKIERAALEGQISGLNSQVESLESRRLELNWIESQIVSQQAELNRLNTRIQELTNQSQELEQRAAELRSLRTSIEESTIDRNNLEARITQLNSQVESLDSRRLELNSIELQIVSQQTELNRLNTRVQELTNQSQELEQRAAELELLRFTYDAILSQKQDYEAKVSQLNPEIDRLELEKQRILQTIEENQNNYQRLIELREKCRSLTLTIRDQESRLRELENEGNNLQTRNHNLQTENHNLQTETDNLQQTRREIETTIANLRGEIREIENSGRVALEPLREKLWTNLPRQVRQLEGETQFIQNFITSLRSEGLSFSSRTIKAFHTSLKVQDISALVILAGISGTGKSELPQRYANYIGAQLLTLAVQPRWDSPQDLQGFYNYLEKKFKPTQLMRGLYQYKDPEMSNRIVIVLLDEMNLARVEYYFSEFLSKLESRRNHATYLEIDVGSLPIAESERRLEIPKAFLFVGTMNEDETTQTLSDKVLDRANVLTFGRPQNLKLRQRSGQQITVNQHSDNLVNNRDSSYVTYSDFKNWVRTPVPESDVVKGVESYLNEANKVMEKMGHPFAHRVYQAIAQYVVNYPEVNGIDSESFKFALADQFGQKLLPKLRGVMVDEAHQQLQEMKEIIDKINDEPLIKAFDKAKEGRYGQFSWQGLVYEDEEA